MHDFDFIIRNYDTDSLGFQETEKPSGDKKAEAGI
jgi:hypothetical protein